MARQPPEEVLTTAVCEAEIRYGLARLPRGRRRDELTARLLALLHTAFQDRILVFDSACATLYGEIRATREAAGRPITVEDAMIAAIVRAHGATLVTRNVADFDGTGARTLDPWAG